MRENSSFSCCACVMSRRSFSSFCASRALDRCSSMSCESRTSGREKWAGKWAGKMGGTNWRDKLTDIARGCVAHSRVRW
eukprot:1590494-Pleurochrysis_carterae.AAC.1